MKDNLLKIAIITIIITIIVITILLILLLKSDITKDIPIEEEGVGHIDFSQLDKVTNRNEYYKVKNIFDKYNNTINNLGENADSINILQDMIDKECKEYLDLNENNIENEFKQYKNNVYEIEDMYYVEKNINTKIYYIKGLLDYQKEFKVIIKLDLYTETFSIYTQQYIEQKNYDETSIETNFNVEGIEYINSNSNNQYSTVDITDEKMAQYYLDDYCNKVINSIDRAYEVIDEEYKQKRFPTIEDYKNYIENTSKNYNLIAVSQYSVKEYDDYVKFTCKDQDGDTYIFKDTEVMKYTVQLDNYTLSNSEYNSEYENQTNEEKVKTNIEKIFKMLDMKDYKAVYNYLNSTFRTNNFSTLEQFETYAKNTFFDYNILGQITIEEQGTNYVIKVPYKDGPSSVAEKRSKVFVMRLLEETNFEISFEID